MTVTLSNWQESTSCTWCEKTCECVTADFGDGFITTSPLCWKCLQQAVRVHHKQTVTGGNAKPARQTERT